MLRRRRHMGRCNWRSQGTKLRRDLLVVEERECVVGCFTDEWCFRLIHRRSSRNGSHVYSQKLCPVCTGNNKREGEELLAVSASLGSDEQQSPRNARP